MTDENGYSRNGNGAYTDSYLGLGTEEDQYRGGVSSADSRYAAEAKMNAYRHNESMKQQEHITSQRPLTPEEAEASQKAISIVFRLIAALAVTYLVLHTFFSFVGSLRATQATVVAKPGYLDVPAEFFDASERPLPSWQTKEMGNNDLEHSLSWWISSRHVITEIIRSCGPTCARPSSAVFVKYFGYVSPGNRQDYLQLACQKDQFSNLFINQAVLEPTTTGCHIRDYEKFKDRARILKEAYLSNNAKEQVKVHDAGLTSMLKFGAILLAEIIAIGWWLKRMSKKKVRLA